MKSDGETPIERARRIREMLPSQRRALKQHPDTTAAYLRLAKLLPDMVDKLEAAMAPQHVTRFVAFGGDIAARCIRLVLALYLRRPVAPGRPSRSLTGMTWLANAEQCIAEDIFLASALGATATDWIRKSLAMMGWYSAKPGSFDPAFWIELDRRVRGIPLEEFFTEIARRVAAKPKRAAPRGSRGARAPRPQALSAQEKRELRAVVAQLVADGGLREQVAGIVRERAAKPLGDTKMKVQR
jgi:hypothetical protein